MSNLTMKFANELNRLLGTRVEKVNGFCSGMTIQRQAFYPHF